MFLLIDTGRFERGFEVWARSFGAPLDQEVVAIDGKTIRDSFDRGREQRPLHVVRISCQLEFAIRSFSDRTGLFAAPIGNGERARARPPACLG